MLELRQALQYVAAFNGELFVIVPDPAVQKQFLEFQLPDIELLSQLGIRIHLVLSNGAQIDQPAISVSKVDKADVATVACSYAVAKKASKVIFMLSSDGVHDSDGLLLNCLDCEQASDLLKATRESGTGAHHDVITGLLRQMIECGISISDKVDRVHFIGARANSLLEELFTGSGCGTLLVSSLSAYTVIRQGKRQDTGAIEIFLRNTGVPQYGSVNPAEFLLACKDDEILASIRTRETSGRLIIDCAAVQPGLPVDEYFDKLLGELMVSSLAQSEGVVEIKLQGCHDWILLSPVPATHGFAKKAEGSNWLLTK